MNRSRTFALSVASLLALAPAVVAGPIPGGTRIEFLGGTVLPGDPADPGNLVFAPGTGGSIATITFTPFFSGPGVYGYSDPNWQNGSSNYVTAQSQFTVAFRVTDDAGRSGETTVRGLAQGEWFHRWDGSWVPSFAWLGQDGGPGELTLGMTRYQFRIDGNGVPFNDPVAASVLVEASPAPAIPEPTTLALASLGLGMAALRRTAAKRCRIK